MKNTRLTRNERRIQILDAGVAAAEEHGYMNLTAGLTAEEAGISRGLVQFYFNDKKILQEAVFKEALRLKNLRIIAQAVLLQSPLLKDTSMELQKKAIDHIVSGNSH